MKTVNEYGRMEIKEFLQNNHKYFINREISCNDTMLYAWALDAEFQMQEGNSPTIEIPAYKRICNYFHNKWKRSNIMQSTRRHKQGKPSRDWKQARENKRYQG